MITELKTQENEECVGMLQMLTNHDHKIGEHEVTPGESIDINTLNRHNVAD